MDSCGIAIIPKLSDIQHLDKSPGAIFYVEKENKFLVRGKKEWTYLQVL